MWGSYTPRVISSPCEDIKRREFGAEISTKRTWAEASTRQQGPPQALTTVGRPIHHRRSYQARHVQAGERKRRSPHQCLEHTTAMSILYLEFQAVCTHIYHFLKQQRSMLYLFIFWELSGPSGARRRTNTEVRLALSSATPSLPRGLLRGNPRTSLKIAMFFRKISVFKFLVYLERKTQGVSD